MKRMTMAFVILTAFSLVFGTMSAKERSASKQELPFLQADRDSGWQGPYTASQSRLYSRDTVVVWEEDFELDAEGWYVQQGWELTENSYNSPTHSMWFDDDNYGMVNSIISPIFTLPELEDDNENIRFSFMLWCDFPDFDGDGDNFLEDYYSVSLMNPEDVAWHPSNFNAYEGNSWWCGKDEINGYLDSWLQYLDTPTISIPSSGYTLSAQMAWGIEDPAGASVANSCTDGWDASNVRISIDGGTTWELLVGSDPYDFDYGYGWIWNDIEYDCPPWGGDLEHLAAGWGDQASWHNVTFSLDDYAGEDITIRFAFGSDPAYSTPDDPSLTGFRVDDISVSNGSDELFFDNADGDSDMLASGEVWVDQFYDYGDITRPGGSGWDSYDPGDPFNGNVNLDLSDFAGSSIQMKWQARVDDNDDGGNGEGLFIDDILIWKIELIEHAPVPQNLVAEASDALVTLSWDAIGPGAGGEIAYDNDDGSGGFFTNGIYSTGGVFMAAELFNAPFGAAVETARIYGYDSNTGTETTIYGFDAFAGIIEDTPLYSKDISLTTGAWNDIDLSADGWEFEGDFAIAFDVGTFDDASIMYAPLDESAVPSAHSYVNFGSWATWQSTAETNGLPDGEWGIRAVVGGGGEVDVAYNIYRHTEGGEYSDPLWYGEAWPDPTFEDPFVINGNTYYYVVTAVYNYGTPDEMESDFSNEVSAIPEAATIYEMAYDDGTAESGVTPLGDGGLYAVHFVPGELVTLVSLKYYATGEGGLTWVYLWTDDGEDGMPGSQIGTTLLFSSVIEGWNEKDVSTADIVISDGGFYVGWGETSLSPQLGLDTDSPDDVSYYQIPGEAWGSISDLGYNGDLMIRAKVDAAVSVDQQDAGLPTEFTLRQNYPNPFNPVTFIPFDLPSGQHVKLDLYDVTGRLVQTLVNENLPAGRYSYHLDASDLATGVYIYQIETEKNSAAKKLILVK